MKTTTIEADGKTLTLTPTKVEVPGAKAVWGIEAGYQPGCPLMRAWRAYVKKEQPAGVTYDKKGSPLFTHHLSPQKFINNFVASRKAAAKAAKK